jgi:hypothetical protein
MDVDSNLITIKLTSSPTLAWMDFFHFSYTMDEVHPTPICNLLIDDL